MQTQKSRRKHVAAPETVAQTCFRAAPLAHAATAVHPECAASATQLSAETSRLTPSPRRPRNPRGAGSRQCRTRYASGGDSRAGPNADLVSQPAPEAVGLRRLEWVVLPHVSYARTGAPPIRECSCCSSISMVWCGPSDAHASPLGTRQLIAGTGPRDHQYVG